MHFETATLPERPLLSHFDDHSIFQSVEWIRFIQETQGAKPVVAALRDGSETPGWFTGLMVKKCGISILGSPFPGWTTSYMGFNLEPGVMRSRVLEAFVDYAFHDLKCWHFELLDRRLETHEAEALELRYRSYAGLEIDLTRSVEQLFGSMSSACRRCIRKSEREGVAVEVADDTSFADEFYSQLREVFARQHLTPTYPLARVHSLVKHLLPTGRLLMLRARDLQGECIATGIFPAMNDTMYFWGGASRRKSQILRPNEAIQWFAMKYWQERGMTRYDMGGGGEYKKKYGGHRIVVPWIRESRYPFIPVLRDAARTLVRIRRRIGGLGHRTS